MTRLVVLSHPLSENAPVWPGNLPAARIELKDSIERGNVVNMTVLHLFSHSGHARRHAVALPAGRARRLAAPDRDVHVLRAAARSRSRPASGTRSRGPSWSRTNPWSPTPTCC